MLNLVFILVGCDNSAYNAQNTRNNQKPEDSPTFRVNPKNLWQKKQRANSCAQPYGVQY